MISFVGAGPGDFELLTVKGQRRLQQADLVIYDRLVNPLLLFYCPADCEFLYVGKTPYENGLTQAQINQLLIEKAAHYSRIVRLKGGDPAIFGRLVEELEAIDQKAISYEIIPGVTSASGSAAYSGMPLTEREVARSVTFTTGHLNDGIVQTADFSPEQTICLYMGVSALKTFIPKLYQTGFAEATKIAVIGWGTYGRQQKITGTLSTILDQLVVQPIKNPAMIIIGEVVSKSQEFNWFEQLPKFGQRILLVATRAPEMAELSTYTEQGADIWWHQVGDTRDDRFDEVSARYLAEQTFETIVFIDEQAKEFYKGE